DAAGAGRREIVRSGVDGIGGRRGGEGQNRDGETLLHPSLLFWRPPPPREAAGGERSVRLLPVREDSIALLSLGTEGFLTRAAPHAPGIRLGARRPRHANARRDCPRVLDPARPSRRRRLSRSRRARAVGGPHGAHRERDLALLLPRRQNA